MSFFPKLTGFYADDRPMFSTTVATWPDGGILEFPLCPAYITPVWSLHVSGQPHTVSSLWSYNYWDFPINRTLNILFLMLQYCFIASKVLLIISNEPWNWANTLIKCLKCLRLTFKFKLKSNMLQKMIHCETSIKWTPPSRL